NGVGEGNLTQATQYPGGSAANRVTQNWFDWRDREDATKGGVQASEDTTTHRPIFYYTLDNLGEVTMTQQFDGDGVTLTYSNGVPQPPSASLLRAQSTSQGPRITDRLHYCAELALVKGRRLRFSSDSSLFKEKKHGHVCVRRRTIFPPPA